MVRNFFLAILLGLLAFAHYFLMQLEIRPQGKMIGWVATSFVIADDRNIEDSELGGGEDPVYAAFR